MRADVARRERTDVQWASLAVGAAFLLVGILGFVPGITTDYDTMAFLGPDSDAKLLGIFEVSILHNIVHLLYGAVGIWAGLTSRDLARTFLIVGGIVYLLIGVYGVLVGDESTANFVPMNTGDNVLHFVLGSAMVALGYLLGRDVPRAAAT